MAMIAAFAGHGEGEFGAKQFPGILQGKDVVWVAQDYPNLSTVMWREEFIPRFKHLPYVSMNENQHLISIKGLGTLYLRPETAINGIRGIGKNLGGVILDEAAFYDLESSLIKVILPALLDNGGWLMIMSTTNADNDGAKSETGTPRTPSYFNIICEQIRAGKRGPEWQEFTGTAFDNPRLNEQAINELIAEYTPGSADLEQEVFAKLLTGGVGKALPLLNAKAHIVPAYKIPDHWPQFGGFDWGFNHPWVFGWYASDEDGNIVKIDTIHGREEQKEQIHTQVAQAVPLRQLRSIIAGADIFFRKGRAIGFQGPTIAEYLISQSWRLVQADVRPGSRAKGLDNLRNYVYYEEDEDGAVIREPRLTFMDTAGNRHCMAQMQAMQLDPLDREDALKVDADRNGKGGDDDYDETRMALSSRPCKARGPQQGVPDHKQPNRAAPVQVKDGKLVKTERPPKTIEEMVEWAARRQNGNGRLPHIQRSPTRR